MTILNRALVFSLVVAGLVVTSRVRAQQSAPQQSPTRDTRQGTPGVASTGAISGAVVSADGGNAVSRVRVTLSGGDPTVTKSTLSDSQGQFTFTALGAGDYKLTASKPGYLDAEYGQKQPGSSRPGSAVRLLANQRLDKASIRLPRGSVITGNVREESAEPAFGVTVRAYRYSMQSGERVLSLAGTATTDDRGIYRIAVLTPGEYIVGATPRSETTGVAWIASGRTQLDTIDLNLSTFYQRAKPATLADQSATTFANVYYPGTTQPGAATPFMLALGEERGGIDLQLQLVPTGQISGGIVGVNGTVPSVQLFLIDPLDPTGLSVRSTSSGPDGRFTFSGVPPGSYTVLARSSPGVLHFTLGGEGVEGKVILSQRSVGNDANKVDAKNAKIDMKAAADANGPLWGSADVSTDGRDIPNVVVTLQPGVNLSGAVVFESAPASLNFARMTVRAVPVGAPVPGLETPAPKPAQLDDSGRFTISGLIPGAYRIVPSGPVPASYAIKSSVFNGRDTLDSPLEIKGTDDIAGGVLTFTTKTTALTGTMQDSQGQPVSDYTLIVFAADERFWTPQSRRIAATRPSTDGRYNFQLPPGDYRLVAVTDIEPGQWFDPALLRQLVGASMAVTLIEGETKTQSVRVK